MQEKWVFKSENINELEIFLSLYTKLDGALAENIQLIEPLTSANLKSGNVSLGFNKSYYNACLNINETDLEHIKLSYDFKPEEGQLILSGPDIPEREPDDL